MLFADRPPETFGRTTRLFPFNMLSVVRQSHALHLGDFRHDGDGLTELMKFDGERTFARFDGVDFARFAVDGRINRPMVETVLEPFGKTTLNRVERLSAAEAIRFFHFYFMGNPEGLGFSYLARDSVTAIVEPLRRRLRVARRPRRHRQGRAAPRASTAAASRAWSSTRGRRPSRALTLALGRRAGRAGAALPQPDGSSIFVRRARRRRRSARRPLHAHGLPGRARRQPAAFAAPATAAASTATASRTAGPPQARRWRRSP